MDNELDDWIELELDDGEMLVAVTAVLVGNGNSNDELLSDERGGGVKEEREAILCLLTDLLMNKLFFL